MNSINIYGRLVRDPELKAYTNSKGESNTMCNFTVAVNRRFGDDADFFNCTIFGKRAEVIDKFFRKASRIAVSGEMQCNKKMINIIGIYLYQILTLLIQKMTQ